MHELFVAILVGTELDSVSLRTVMGSAFLIMQFFAELYP